MGNYILCQLLLLLTPPLLSWKFCLLAVDIIRFGSSYSSYMFLVWISLQEHKSGWVTATSGLIPPPYSLASKNYMIVVRIFVMKKRALAMTIYLPQMMILFPLLGRGNKHQLNGTIICFTRLFPSHLVSQTDKYMHSVFQDTTLRNSGTGQYPFSSGNDTTCGSAYTPHGCLFLSCPVK